MLLSVALLRTIPLILLIQFPATKQANIAPPRACVCPGCGAVCDFSWGSVEGGCELCSGAGSGVADG
jgi:hypothetical protein